MIYINNNGIIPINESIFDKLFKKKKTDTNHNKTNRNDKKSNVNNKTTDNNSNDNSIKMKTEFTREELDMIYEKDEKLIEGSYDALTKLLHKLIDESNVAKAFSITPIDDVYAEKVIYENYYALECEFPILLNNIAYVDIWEVIPEARGTYKTDPKYKEIEKLCQKIINTIENYFSGKGVNPVCFLDGDWDTFGIVMVHPVSDFGYKLNDESINESTIFRYADLI